MDPLAIIEKYYPQGSPLYSILVDHSRQVAKKSIEIASNLTRLNPGLKPDMAFIENAAMLHDIGIFKTRARSIGCSGEAPYICHGFIGKELLNDEGLDPAFGLVAERHTGAGITLDNIVAANLPLPHRDMVPISLEEKIICCADKYYSKSPKKKGVIMTRDLIIEELAKINPGHARRFTRWAEEFYL